MFEDYFPDPKLSPGTRTDPVDLHKQDEPTDRTISWAIGAALGYFSRNERLELPMDLNDRELMNALFYQCDIEPTEEPACSTDVATVGERAKFVFGSLTKILGQYEIEPSEPLSGPGIAGCFTKLELKKARVAH